jgi:6-phosphofructokinase 1
MSKNPKRIGILTAGGDCPGLNAAIRGIAKSAMLEYGMEVVGVRGGFAGLREPDTFELDDANTSGILTRGGTILGTSRVPPFGEDEEKRALESDYKTPFQQHYERLGLDCLVCLGGNGTMTAAHILQRMGMNVVGLPKTIDNDLAATDVTFGFRSACQIASDAIDRIHTTAQSHHRVMVVEVMGRDAGWLALEAGVSGGGDVILIPEIPYRIEAVADYIRERHRRGKPLSLVILAEGARAADPGADDTLGKGAPKFSKAHSLAQELEDATRLQTRVSVLGYIQRGGSPVQFDRVLATTLGVRATELIVEGRFGEMVAVDNNDITSVPLERVAGRTRLVPPDHHLVKAAKKIWTCFGDE